MRKIVYSVAMSVDGYIAAADGGYDWIAPDPAFDFGALYARFDTLLMGRKTFELMEKQGMSPASMGMKAVVVSTTLTKTKLKGVTFVSSGVNEAVAALKAEAGKDIWLFGGAVLFRSLLDAGLVDSIELSTVPVLLGGGMKLVPDGRRWPLKLVEWGSTPGGRVTLKYAVMREGEAVAETKRAKRAKTNME